MIIFGLLQKLPFEMCPRTPFFTTHYERCLFSSFALLIVPLAPSWPRVCERHKTFGFYRTGWPSPFKHPRKMLTFALGLPGELCRKESSRRHLGPIFGRLGPILTPRSQPSLLTGSFQLCVYALLLLLAASPSYIHLFH